jgi:hypothetical protein
VAKLQHKKEEVRRKKEEVRRKREEGIQLTVNS